MLGMLQNHSCFGRVGGRHCLQGWAVPDPHCLQVCREPRTRQGGLCTQILLGIKM